MTSPGSRTLPAGLAYEGFPSEEEGPHWLRWIDGVDLGGRGTGSPLVHVHLSPAGGGPGSTASPDLASLAIAHGSRAVAVHAAAVPFLRLGTVFVAGVAMGSLPMARRSFTFEADRTAVASLRTFDPCPLTRPHWWKSPWSVLPRQAYSLDGDLRQSQCLVLTTGTTQLIVAGSEIFRAFCAPEPLLAETLLSGPWELLGGRVVNASWIDELEDHWEIGLRSGLTAASALPAAAFALTDFGRGVAAGIQGARIGGRGHWRWLTPGIPYEWTAMELEVSGLAFPPEHAQALGLDRFMVLRIETIRWPAPLAGLPARIVYRLDNYTTVHGGRDPTSAEPVRHVPTHRAPVPDEVTGTVPLTPDFAPSDTADPVVVAFRTTPMEGGPMIERMPLTDTGEVERTGGKPFDAGRLPFASAGRSGGGSSPAAPLRPTVDDGAAAVPAFGDIVDALNALHRGGSISRWAPVVPIDDKAAVRGEHTAWLFPGWRAGRRNAWSYLPNGRRRSALVAAVALPQGQLHLIEIERRGPTEAFSLLLLQAPQEDMQRNVGALLAAAALVDGVWARAAPDLAANEAPRSTRWSAVRHPVAGQRIDPDRLLRALDRFLDVAEGVPSAGKPLLL